MNFFASPPPQALATSAHEQAYHYLSHAIRMGQLKPGERLVADDIANAIGMSRMPVREAFRRLAAEGLLVMPPNRGAIVRALSEFEVVEVFEMRAVLEGLAASMAVRRHTPRDIADLEDLLAGMRRCGSDLSQWITVHRQFHERLCGISAAPRLLQQISALHSVVEPLMRIWLENQSGCCGVQQVHERLLAVLQAGDPERMEQEMRAHVRRTVDGITSAMRAARPAKAARRSA
ncbi:GntR family transcriptional regulator [Comamonas endophytica]|uniref:GntR family transcriptional regulator n=1 Tax=Comamonas endophytica TaxID=2949090 RepID=A0ABY6G7S7_9BURK|nr:MULTISPECIES: GntR family transcriptional regulator [unclassified Acidovorax]MCD2514500.1 GntR family transcriptional regulator [Acidovorax sp. D4N7]UYG51080.1 GntR family transcriptional regulator [Acidovorax sp. 5MLIR]